MWENELFDDIFDDIFDDEREVEFPRGNTCYESYVCGYARTKDIQNAIAEYERSNMWD